MKRFLLCCLVFTSLFIAPLYAQSLNRVVAVVNNEVITQSELNAEIAKANQQMAASKMPQSIDPTKLRQMVLQKLIDEKVVLELAKQAKMTVTDEQVDQAIQHIATSNHMTVAQLQQALKQEGMNLPDYKKMIHKQILIHQVEQSAVGSLVHVTPADIAAAKKQVQQQAQMMQQYHILDAVAATKADAEKMMVAMKNGQTANANDLGWQTENTLPALFMSQLATMSAGDIAGPLQAPNGFHVIKLIAKRGPQNMPNADQIKNIAYQMQMEKQVQKWLATIRKTAYIKVLGS